MAITRASAAAEEEGEQEEEDKEEKEEAAAVAAAADTDVGVTATCVGLDACCCTVPPLGRALWVVGCRSRDPFCTPGVTPLAVVVGRKDRVCIVLQSRRAFNKGKIAGSGYMCCKAQVWT